MVDDLTSEALINSQAYFKSRMDDLRAAVADSADYDDAARRGLAVASAWDSDPLGRFMGDALRLSALTAREAVFREVDGEEDTDLFADADNFGQPFKEQIEFLEQKRVKPTDAWRDALRGDHDRSFVVAGATDTKMLEDFQNSLVRNRREGKLFRDFQKDFDRIVAQYGWEFNGDRQWRARTIFETNLRTSYAAGRLAQMRDPDVIALRPYWQYKHAVTREPKRPRAAHVGWHDLVLRHDDAFWSTAYPPNGWKCSCGVVTLNERDLKSEGKSRPDRAPVIAREPYIDPLTGTLIEKVQHIDYGFEYQPGDLWERGLVPSNLIREAGGVSGNARLVVDIDTPKPFDDLVANAVPFDLEPLPDNLSDEDYLNAFLEPFGATASQAVRFVDRSGASLPISSELFRERGGDLKLRKQGRHRYGAHISATIMDPDEIWLGVREVKVHGHEATEWIVDRRYIRVDPDTGVLVVFQVGKDGWEEVTAFNPSNRSGKKPDLNLLANRRGGKLLYKRKK